MRLLLLIGTAVLAFGCAEQPIGQPCSGDSGCTDGQFCVGGQCQSCPACAQGEVCIGTRCLPATCGDEPCHAGYGCLEGTCRSAECLEVACASNQTCVRGTCYPRDCGDSVCGSSGVCEESSGCTFIGCLGVTCAPAELCADGTCHEQSCVGVTCANGAACADGRCVPVRCIGVECGSEALCVRGRCAPVSCDGHPCAPGAACHDGRCRPVGCIGLSCPGQRCEPETSTCEACFAQEASCRDGQDDDCDGKEDCLDSDCWGPNDCNCGGEPSETRCADELDDDCDGLIDCGDPECLGAVCGADPCMTGSQCAADGTCSPGTPKVCDAPPAACFEESGTCEPASGACQYAPKPEGTPCPDEGNPCTGDTCDPAGLCLHEPHADGTSCGASGQTCQGGLCPVGVTPVAGTASVIGTPLVGQTLTAVATGFSLGSPAGVYSYVWERCTTAACTSATAVGTNSPAYTLVAADVDAHLRVGIRATNLCGSGCGSSAAAQSAATGLVQGIAPAAGSAWITGTPRVGQTLTAVPAGFSLGSPAGVYSYTWERCTTSACTSTIVAGGDSPTYTLGEADLNAYLRVGIRVANTCSAGCGVSAPALSAATGVVQGVAPVAGAASVTGTPGVGQTLTAVPAGFSLGSPAGVYSYTWQRCTTAACTSATTVGADSPTYTLVAADLDAYLRVGIRATNLCASGCGSSATVQSAAISVEQGIAPTAGSASVTGTPRVGQTLTAVAAGFSLGIPAGAYSYAWQRCTTAACTTVTPVGSDSPSYTLVPADVDAYLRVGILATNTCSAGCGASATAQSAATGVVQGLAPVAGSVSVTGTPRVGQTLTAVPAGFSLGSPAGAYSYAWQRCTTAACTTATSVGSNSSTYTLVAADLDAYLRVGIQVTNTCGSGCGTSATAQSAATGVVQGIAPAAGSASVTGTPRVGQTLTAAAAGFSLGTPAGVYSYAWQRCTTSACTTTTPVGSNAPTYALVPADVDAYLRVGIRVTNTCSSGCGPSTIAQSAATGVVQGIAPIAGSASVTGTPGIGQVLTAVPAGFSLGSPAAVYSYAWQRCTTSACTSATSVGSDSPTYTPVAADLNAYLRVGIRATNTCSSGCGSSATVQSAAISVEQGLAPTAGSASVTGTPRVGQTLTAVAAGFSLGVPTGVYSYAWQRCTTATCTTATPVGGNSPTYTLVAADLDAYLRVGIQVTNTCSAGCGSSATAQSAATGVVQGIAPVAGSASVTGTPGVGQTLTAAAAGFSLGTPAGVYSYAWQRCTTSACTTTTAVGSNSPTYTLVPADVDAFLRVGILATNTCSSGCGSSAVAHSTATGVVQGIAPAAGSASVTGTPRVGQTLTAVPAGFSLGSPAGVYSYAWQRCTTAACTTATPVGGNAPTYTLVAADLNAYLRVGIQVTNTCGSGCGSSATVQSAATAVVQGIAPVAGSASVTGTPRVGQTLTAAAAGFSLGTPAGVYSYAWQRCTTSACTTATAVGGNASTYTLVAADVNAYMRVGISVTNTCSAGCGSSAIAQSAATGVVQGIAPTAGSVSVSGTAAAGSTLTATVSGFNRGTPTGAYTYVWQRCTTSACSSATTVGGNSSTYTLAAGDGGSYVRVRVSVTNSCTSGCGTSATVSSSVLGPIKSVTLSKGASCQYVISTCTNAACRWYSINAVGFAAGSHTVTCNAANLSNPWSSFSVSSFPVDGRCCYGYPGQGTWATVDGVRSNTLTW